MANKNTLSSFQGFIDANPKVPIPELHGAWYEYRVSKGLPVAPLSDMVVPDAETPAANTSREANQPVGSLAKSAIPVIKQAPKVAGKLAIGAAKMAAGEALPMAGRAALTPAMAVGGGALAGAVAGPAAIPAGVVMGTATGLVAGGVLGRYATDTITNAVGSTDYTSKEKAARGAIEGVVGAIPVSKVAQLVMKSPAGKAIASAAAEEGAGVTSRIARGLVGLSKEKYAKENVNKYVTDTFEGLAEKTGASRAGLHYVANHPDAIDATKYLDVNISGTKGVGESVEVVGIKPKYIEAFKRTIDDVHTELASAKNDIILKHAKEKIPKKEVESALNNIWAGLGEDARSMSRLHSVKNPNQLQKFIAENSVSAESPTVQSVQKLVRDMDMLIKGAGKDMSGEANNALYAGRKQLSGILTGKVGELKGVSEQYKNLYRVQDALGEIRSEKDAVSLGKDLAENKFPDIVQAYENALDNSTTARESWINFKNALFTLDSTGSTSRGQFGVKMLPVTIRAGGVSKSEAYKEAAGIHANRSLYIVPNKSDISMGTKGALAVGATDAVRTGQTAGANRTIKPRGR